MTGPRRDPAASPDVLADDRRPNSSPAPERSPEAPDAGAATKDGEAPKKRARKRRAPFVL